MNKVTTYLLVFLFVCQYGFAQSKKDAWMMNQLLDTPQQLTLDVFLTQWFGAHSCSISDGWLNFSYMKEIGRDGQYAYFKYETKMRSDRYKVLLSDLERVKFDTWTVCGIKDEFFLKAVAEKDRERQTDWLICTSTPSSAKYTYTYILNTNSVRIDLHWKIYCEIIFKLVNKKYCAMYDFDKGSFTYIQ